jgi:hypothetical protein
MKRRRRTARKPNEAVRGALAADDAAEKQGDEPRFRVRETPNWKKHAADLEAEMLKRRNVFRGDRLVRGPGNAAVWGLSGPHSQRMSATWRTPGRRVCSAAASFPDGVLSGSQQENSTMILKLTTSQKAEVWVNLDQIMQMTTISVQDGYPSTEIIMVNGAAVNVYEKPVDIANWTKVARSGSV